MSVTDSAAAISDVRKRLFALMTATEIDERKNHPWSYQAVRPLTVPEAWKPGQRVVGDCSKGVQYLCKWAAAPDPMRNNFDVWGNSQTIWAALPPVATVDQLEVGDLIVFGQDGRDHATMVYQADRDPMMWSFGHQGAPNFYRLSQDGRQHYFRRLMVDPPVVPAVEYLRAQTGFYAWVAWRLGEGEWKHYGPHVHGVRPRVPAVISADWWTRYLRFLAGRKKANPATT